MQIKIKFQNGLSFKNDLQPILGLVEDKYQFIESDDPEVIIFGPYGVDFPAPGPYIRIGYFCECIKPDFSLCEYAFGIPRENSIKKLNYARIQWHGLDPALLKRPLTENEIDRLISLRNKKFCNFLYSNSIPYREEFFRQLSKYKKIDAPGKSMRNMPSIDELYQGNFWERKRKFIHEYKFTIAFENYTFPGYQTEKLYDAMLVKAVPIYLGDPYIDELFNLESFINARSYMKINRSALIQSLETALIPSPLVDCSPSFNNRFDQKIIRKIKTWGRHTKMYFETNRFDFEELIEK